MWPFKGVRVDFIIQISRRQAGIRKIYSSTTTLMC
uniref:Uncharacterized protein n=1 Tax=Arundo donax TaxID=35708 RepID=A0A0A9G3J8_ARUDO